MEHWSNEDQEVGFRPTWRECCDLPREGQAPAVYEAILATIPNAMTYYSSCRVYCRDE